MTSHAKLRREICAWLKEIGAWYVCTNSQGYGRKGIPDILCCIRGKFVAIEVKVAPDKPSPWQWRELYGDDKGYPNIRDAQGIPLVAYSLASVKADLCFDGVTFNEGLGQLAHDILSGPAEPVIEPDGKGGFKRKALPFKKLCS